MFDMINQFLIRKALNLSRVTKRVIAILLDSFLCVCATWMALSLRLDEFIIFNWEYIIPVLFSIGIVIPVFIWSGFYKVIFRYETGNTIQILAKGISIYTLIYSIIFVLINIQNIPRSIGLIQPMILFLMIGASRLIIKFWLNQFFLLRAKGKVKKGVIVYGAGNSGRQLASNLIHSHEFDFLFFVDDNKSFWEGTIDGHIVKPPLSINKFINKEKENELWLAIPKLSSSKRRSLISHLNNSSLHIRTLPSFSDLTNSKIKLSDIRELNVNELLGRDAVKPNTVLLQKCISEKTVLVTGAGGSIGSELCRQILNNEPKCILLLDSSEIALYNIHLELQSLISKKLELKYKDIILIPLLASIQDENRLNHIFKTWKPYTVYHAAAYKHVPMVEHNVEAGIKNNVIGTVKCANAAIKNNVKHFVLVSTDKAVRPTNIMGASKRLAETALQLLNNDLNNNNTCFCMVRFGNVLGSSGSVVPLFRKQIKFGGPLTLTDDKVTRYFMTVTEASQLVIQAGQVRPSQ